MCALLTGIHPIPDTFIIGTATTRKITTTFHEEDIDNGANLNQEASYQTTIDWRTRRLYRFAFNVLNTV